MSAPTDPTDAVLVALAVVLLIGFVMAGLYAAGVFA